jgi:hypothetical protein
MVSGCESLAIRDTRQRIHSRFIPIGKDCHVRDQLPKPRADVQFWTISMIAPNRKTGAASHSAFYSHPTHSVCSERITRHADNAWDSDAAKDRFRHLRWGHHSCQVPLTSERSG